MNCIKCNDKGFTLGKNTFPNGREKIVCECQIIKTDDQLSENQFQNWRKVLCSMIGPYALIMSEEEILRFKKQMETRLN